MNFIKNITATTLYFISMICFLVGYLLKSNQPLVYLVAMILGILFCVLGFLKRTNR